ncbi:MAG: FIST N-terminal domain-containing protein [Anaerolineae bacterium]
MKIEQRKWSPGSGWGPTPAAPFAEDAGLVLAFAGAAALQAPGLIASIGGMYPRAHVLGCSTAGEIYGTQVSDDTLVLTAVHFEHAQLAGARVDLREVPDSFAAGAHLAQALPHTLAAPGAGPDVPLAHVLVLSDGLKVNGSDLVSGLIAYLPEGVTLTGGLAGDGPRFGETLVFWNCAPAPNTIAVMGLYSRRLRVGFGSLGGWDSFGPERLITRSQGNVLYELDGESVLGLYKKYLGEHAKGLPATGLLFPLSLRSATGETGVVRTILGMDEQAGSLTFAGDVPVGAHARMMKANFDRLIDGAVGAAQTSYRAIGSTTPELALLISCVGRKLVRRSASGKRWPESGIFWARRRR